jgi:hypothetical protein
MITDGGSWHEEGDVGSRGVADAYACRRRGTSRRGPEPDPRPQPGRFAFFGPLLFNCGSCETELSLSVYCDATRTRTRARTLRLCALKVKNRISPPTILFFSTLHTLHNNHQSSAAMS